MAPCAAKGGDTETSHDDLNKARLVRPSGATAARTRLRLQNARVARTDEHPASQRNAPGDESRRTGGVIIPVAEYDALMRIVQQCAAQTESALAELRHSFDQRLAVLQDRSA